MMTTSKQPSCAAPAAHGCAAALPSEARRHSSGHRTLLSPMLWAAEDLAAFVSCLGVSQSAVSSLRQSRLRGPDHLLLMTDAELRSQICLDTPAERHVVRRALKHLLELDRFENARLGRRSPETLDDLLLREFEVPLLELELGQELSAGGFGHVSRGVLRPRANRGRLRKGQPLPVAVKAMKGSRQVRLKELLKESRVMASLDHPNLCRFVGICSEGCRKGSSQYILSELMDCSLFDMVHKANKLSWRGTLTVPCALSIFDGTCRGLEYLHSRKLVHADLKSPNILIDYTTRPTRPIPKICDFGHAVLLTRPTPHNRCGTPHWAAPEALRNEAVGPAADVFSLAVVLWEMLAREVPFVDLTFGQVVDAVGWAGWTLDTRRLSHLPRPLPDFLLQCWAFVPSERPSVMIVRKLLSQIRHRPQRDALGMLVAFLGGLC